MFESTPECFSNCLRTQKGTHLLYRKFGINWVDGYNINVKNDIIEQLATYFPEVSLDSVSITRKTANGEAYYEVEVK